MGALSEYHFSPEHTWAKLSEDGGWLIGITDYAQQMLGDVVFVDAPQIGARVTQFQVAGLVESVKTGSDLYAPLSGEVIAVNESVLANPELLNEHPYESWIFKLSADAQGLDALQSPSVYQASLT